MKSDAKIFSMLILTAFIFLMVIQIISTEHYYVTYNTYVRNDRGEMVEQDENKHLTIDAKSLNKAKEQIFEIENQLYEDVIVDSVAIQSHVIVKEY